MYLALLFVNHYSSIKINGCTRLQHLLLLMIKISVKM